jgi:uncharacterized BrkB/YihY/UPF0761 family membrane protein
MTRRSALALLFGAILVVMTFVTVQASLHQAVWDWGGLTAEPDRYWTIATLADAYCGFLTFYAWVFYKERSAAARAAWFVAIMLLGNFAMATYVLLQLARLRPGEPLERLLLRAPASPR